MNKLKDMIDCSKVFPNTKLKKYIEETDIPESLCFYCKHGGIRRITSDFIVRLDCTQLKSAGTDISYCPDFSINNEKEFKKLKQTRKLINI